MENITGEGPDKRNQIEITFSHLTINMLVVHIRCDETNREPLLPKTMIVELTG